LKIAENSYGAMGCDHDNVSTTSPYLPPLQLLTVSP
jgi:hypothetical protein